MTAKTPGILLTRTHRILVGIVVAGAVIIAGIGFAGSYAAVRTLALHKGFGWFANVFPIGVDAGIVVLLALDLLLTWLRIPFPLLRQTAWLLTAATIAFNGAAAWPDGLGVGMHAIIPVLFVVAVEAARHAIGRIADITADKHMESVRITRWLLAPLPTFRLWRRMKLWELRSYEETIRREQDRLVYRARLRARYGVAWRRRAPIEAIMPLRLAKYGIPLSETADAGLQAAGIEAPATLWSRAAPVPAGLEQALAVLEPGAAESAAGEVRLERAPSDGLVAAATAGQVGEPEATSALSEREAREFAQYQAFVRQYGGFPAAEELQAFTSSTPADPLTDAFHREEGPELPLERQAGWNELQDDTAALEFQPPFQAEDGPVAGAAPYAGVPVARQGAPAGTRVVHARVTQQPQQRALLEPFQEEATEESGDQLESLPAGKAGLRMLFQRLTPAERDQPDNRLAPALAEQVGLSVGTARKYLGAIRREESA